jgi:hypothetical protein
MVADVIGTIVDVITGLLAGIGSAVATYFQTLVLIESETPGVYTDALNPFGVFLFVLLGIGAAFGLASLIFNLVRNRA